MRTATTSERSAIILLSTNVSVTKTMKNYSHIATNPLRRERLVDLAKFRRIPIAAEEPAQIAESEVPPSPEEGAGGGVIEPEPGL